MKNTISLLNAGFESSCQCTPEFNNFFKTFKKEFTKELENANATNIVFSKGHFYISGFFTIGNSIYYFSMSDVRGSEFQKYNHNLMYRTASSYKDYTGGSNQWVKIEEGMAMKMNLKN